MAVRSLTGLKSRQVLRALQRGGFEILRVNGSHHILRRPGGTKRVIVPVHASHDLPPGTVRSIIEQAGLTTAEFMALL